MKKDSEKLLEYMKSHKDEFLSVLEKAVCFESPSYGERNIKDRCGHYLASLFAGLGFEMDELDCGEAGLHFFGRYGRSKRKILLVGHYDTVFPIGYFGTSLFRLEDEKAYGPGVFDMKGGIVSFYMAIKGLQELSLMDNNIEINIILNSDEEAGSGTSRDFILEKAGNAKACLVTEPGFLSVGSIKSQRYGRAVFKVEAQGIAGHAGNHPDRAVSPIVELAHQILKLHALNDFQAGLTISPVALHAGEIGSLAMIPENAFLHLDVRFSTQELGGEIIDTIQNLEPVLNGAKLEITGGLEKPPLELTERNKVLLKLAETIAAELGFEIEPITCGGGSDGNFTSSLCATLDGIGLNGDLLHNPSEYVRTDTIPQRVTLVAELIRRIAKGVD